MLSLELFAQQGIRVSDKTVAKLLRDHGYSLQAPNKSVEGAQHPDRNAQFEHISAKAQDCVERGVPVISVDTKKKELVGNWASTTTHQYLLPPRSRRGGNKFPPGTSKWNKIEHRLFSFISIDWRGRPLRSYETIIDLISDTTNQEGLIVRARLDRRRYPIGKKVSAKELRELKIEHADFHGDWDHVIRPRLAAALND